MRSYTNIAFTPTVEAAQSAHGDRARHVAARMAAMDIDDRHLGPRERMFIGTRDSFFVASVGDNGWPYVQHRGGPVGFLKVLDDRTLAFADYQGNRQYITQGHVAHDDRVALFLIDYPRRQRLKVYARAQVLLADADPAVTAKVVDETYGAELDRIVVLTVEAFDWNCPQHITPRWTAEELRPELERQQAELVALQKENARLQAELAHFTSTCD